ncbi:MAG TPA: SH3 domain-containing protein [Pyrinomonadaceae bacterium]|nr:SH3 domain-containing protein [Pyrinomonadaceae bacterium]
MKNIAILTILISFLGLNTLAQNDKCVQGGWIEDKDPNGTNIRDKPGLDGKVIAVAPHSKDPEQDVMVDIIGYSNGWLKIKSAGNIEGTFGWEGIGWVSAQKVTTNVEHASGKSAPLYALPKRSIKKIGWVPNYADIKIVGYDCFGLKVAYKGKTGWLYSDDICGNVVTTCP